MTNHFFKAHVPSFVASLSLCFSVSEGIANSPKKIEFVENPAETIYVTGHVSKKSAFELQENYVQNSGARFTNYAYQDYKLTFARIPNVAPQDREVVKSALQKLIASKDAVTYPMVFYITRAEIVDKLVHIVGEHTLNTSYKLRLKIEKCLWDLKTPSGKKYTVAMNRKDMYVPSIVVGDTIGGNPMKIGRWINKRITQDALIYNNPAFTVNIESITVD